MKLTKRKIVSLLAVLSTILAFQIGIKNDYTTYSKQNAMVVGKSEEDVRKRGMWGKEYYIHFKLTDGRLYKQRTNPQQFKTTGSGETWTLNIREMDVKQTPMKNLLYFFLPCLWVSLSISILFGVAVDWWLFNEKD